jgi:hypothetical protein
MAKFLHQEAASRCSASPCRTAFHASKCDSLHLLALRALPQQVSQVPLRGGVAAAAFASEPGLAAPWVVACVNAAMRRLGRWDHGRGAGRWRRGSSRSGRLVFPPPLNPQRIGGVGGGGGGRGGGEKGRDEAERSRTRPSDGGGGSALRRTGSLPCCAGPAQPGPRPSRVPAGPPGNDGRPTFPYFSANFSVTRGLPSGGRFAAGRSSRGPGRPRAPCANVGAPSRTPSPPRHCCCRSMVLAYWCGHWGGGGTE